MAPVVQNFIMLSRRVLFALFLLMSACCSADNAQQQNSSFYDELYYDEREDIEPVFMWTNDMSLSFPEPIAGRMMTEDEFVEGYLKPVLTVPQMSVALIVHEEMTLVDLMKAAAVYRHPGEPAVFQNIYEIMDSMPSAFISRVQHPDLTLQHQLKKRFTRNQTLPPARWSNFRKDPTSLVLEPGQDVMIPVEVMNIAGHSRSDAAVKQRRETFQYVDRLVSALKARFDESGNPYTFIYTSIGTPNTVPSMKDYRRVNGEMVEVTMRRFKRAVPDEEETESHEGAHEEAVGAHEEAVGGHKGAEGAAGAKEGTGKHEGIGKHAGAHGAHGATGAHGAAGAHRGGAHHGGEKVEGLLVKYREVFLLYAGNVTVLRNGTEERLETGEGAWSVEEEESECERVEPDEPASNSSDPGQVTPQRCKIVLKYKHRLPEVKMNQLSMIWLFEQSALPSTGYWYLSSFSLRYVPLADDSGEEESAPVTQPMSRQFVEETPRFFSYHCHDTVHVRPVRTSNETHRSLSRAHDDLQLRWNAFQIQVFHFHTPHSFGHYNDCVGFFTIGIWSALITMALFVGAVTFGVYMLLGIATMDRFDDPKSRGMSITVSE